MMLLGAGLGIARPFLCLLQGHLMKPVQSGLGRNQQSARLLDLRLASQQ